MPQMPPPGGMTQGMALQQKLAELMQDPVARAGMQAHMQGGDPRMAGAQMAMQDPRMGMAQRGVPPTVGVAPESDRLSGVGRGGASGPSTDQDLYNAQEANQGVRGNLPVRPDTGGYTGYGEEMDSQQDIRQTPMPDRAEAMAQDKIDKAGNTFDGTDAPTQNDIERLTASPTDSMVEAFDEQFGDGAAAKYINPDGRKPGQASDDGDADDKDY